MFSFNFAGFFSAVCLRSETKGGCEIVCGQTLHTILPVQEVQG